MSDTIKIENLDFADAICAAAERLPAEIRDLVIRMAHEASKEVLKKTISVHAIDYQSKIHFKVKGLDGSPIGGIISANDARTLWTGIGEALSLTLEKPKKAGVCCPTCGQEFLEAEIERLRAWLAWIAKVTTDDSMNAEEALRGDPAPALD